MAEQNNTNTGLLVLIAVVLIGILGVAVYQMSEKSPEEKVADSISQAAEDIGNAAEDAADE